MLRTKKGLLLRKMKNQNFVVAVGEAAEEFNGMIRLNDTGVRYWEQLEKGITEDGLVDFALSIFEKLDRETACRDIREFLEALSPALEEG